MQDMINQLWNTPQTQKMLKSMGVPMGEKLSREKKMWSGFPFADEYFVVFSQNNAEQIAECIFSGGGNIYLKDDVAQKIIFQESAKHYARKLESDVINDGQKIKGVVFDASGFTKVSELETLYSTIHNLLTKLQRNAKIVVIAKSLAAANSYEEASISTAIKGFIKSLSKEVGNKGITANLLYIEKNSVFKNALSFFLSDSSVYVTGQQTLVEEVNKKDRVDCFTPQILSGKTALVTGASRGIGEKICDALTREGAKVIALDRVQEASNLEKVCLRNQATPLYADLNEADSATKISQWLQENTSGLDIVVHNAGITRDKTLKKMSQESWKDTLRINLEAVIELNTKLEKDILKQKSKIVCLSSIAGLAGNFGQTNYAASKAGLVGYIEYFTKNAKRKDIQINAVAPGFIETSMTEKIPFVTKEVARRFSSLMQGGLPEDVAELVAFLASPHSNGTNGQVIRVCGGNLIGA
ncbi:MAG: 3-oxoacyl-ACP reductase [Spirochaetota bacterium]